MHIDSAKKLFSVDEFYRMADAGIFTEDDRVELIDGEVFEMSPIGTRHLGCVNGASAMFWEAFSGRVVVSVQNALRLSDNTEPQADIVLLKLREDAYRGKRPEAEDALLVVEVSDTTLVLDRDVKLPRYAAAGVPEVWIEDLEANALLVYRDPTANAYARFLNLGPGDTVSVGAFPDVPFEVGTLLG